MTNCAAVSYRNWKARVNVEGTVILNVGSFADFNPLIVTAKYSTKPYACTNFYPYPSNGDRGIRDAALI